MNQPLIIPYFHLITDDALIEFYRFTERHPVQAARACRVKVKEAKNLGHFAFNLYVARKYPETRDKYLAICKNIKDRLPEAVRQEISDEYAAIGVAKGTQNPDETQTGTNQ